MFGIWRVLLAIEVVATHLLLVPAIGVYAVSSFFVLSGFLMTAIMHGTYGYSVEGFGRYLGNRALRLFPSYWFAALVSLCLIAVLGARQLAVYNPAITVPPNAASWAENITIIFWNWVPANEIPRLVPPTWALTVEIFYYLLIGLGVSRSRRSTVVWATISATYIVIAHVVGSPDLYFLIPAGSLPFSMGALTWHYRTPLIARMSALKLNKPLLLILMRWVSWALFVGTNMLTRRGWLIPLGNYLDIAISVLIVCALFHAGGSKRLRVIDKRIGDFSYPIYLLHWQGGAIASALIFGELVRGRTLPGAVTMICGLAVTILLALICTRLIDPAIERRRTRIRQRPAAQITA